MHFLTRHVTSFLEKISGPTGVKYVYKLKKDANRIKFYNIYFEKIKLKPMSVEVQMSTCFRTQNLKS